MKTWLALCVLCIGCAEPNADKASSFTDMGALDTTIETRSDSGDDRDGQPPNDRGVPAAHDGGPLGLDMNSPMDAQIEPDAQSAAMGPTIWRGPRITFEKLDGAQPESPEAQDRVTETVVLTRGDGNVLFNIAVESSANGAVSPRGTLWAEGTTESWESLNFTPLREAANNRMQELPGKDMVLFLVEDNIYIDVRFISWRSGRGRGGGFSYARSTPNAAP